MAGFMEWAVTALIDGLVGLVVGMLLIPVVTRLVGPLMAAVSRGKDAHH